MTTDLPISVSRPWIVIAVLQLAVCSSLAAEEVYIDTFPEDGTGASIGEYVASDGIHTEAGYLLQGFVAPAAPLKALSFQFSTGGAFSLEGTEMRVLVTPANVSGLSIRPVDNVLYESEPLVAPLGEGFVTLSADFGGLQLTAGEQYVFVLDTFVTMDGIPGNGELKLRGDNPYPGGHVMKSHTFQSGDRASHFASSWAPMVGTDLAMRVTVVPEPSSLVLLMAGAFALLAHARRRGRKW